jgi:hypothetical protein
MVAGGTAFVVCLILWGARAFVTSKYQVKYRVGGETRRAWKRGTPDWITRAVPWLEFVGWVALLGAIACWALDPVPGDRCLDTSNLLFR